MCRGWCLAGIMDSVVFSEEQRAELHAAEAQIKRRVAIGAHVSERKLVDELVCLPSHPLCCPTTPHTHTQHTQLARFASRLAVCQNSSLQHP